MTIEKIARVQLALFWSLLLTVAIMALAFELAAIGWQGMLAGGGTEFVLLAATELLTIVCIPCALRLFRFSRIRRTLAERREAALLRFGILRISLLMGPLLLNVLLYYLYMQPSFGYMAIVLLLCLAFVYPGKERCNRELDSADGE